MSRKKIWILAAFAVLMFFRGYALFVAEAPSPQAAGGTLDLRDWNLAEDGTVRLEGEWLFYPSAYVDPSTEDPSGVEPVPLQVPGKWDDALSEDGETTFGYGTYRLRVLLSDEDRDRLALALRSSNVRTAHWLYVSGEPVGGSGTPGVDRASTSPQNTPYVAETAVRGDTLTLTVHTANFHYGNQGGVFDTFQLGTVHNVVREEQAEKMVETILGALFLTLGLLFIAVYALRRQNPELFWFGCFFLAYLAFGATHGEKLLFVWWPTLSYEWQSKLQMLSSLSIYFTILWFVRFMFPQYASLWVVRLSTVVTALLTVFCLLSEVFVYSSYDYLLMGFEGLLSLYLMAWLLAGVLTRKTESVYALLGALCLFYEHLFVGLTFLGLQPSNLFFPIEMLAFVFSMGVLLAKRFFDNLKKVEQASMQLVQADRMKSEFLATTSHELRTPLHGMINMAQLSLDEGGLDAAKAERLRLIVSTGRNLSHLLEDILDLSRLNEGTMHINLKAVDLRTAAEGVWELLPYVSEDRTVRFENRVPSDLPRVLADDQRVMQILFNLLNNAMKHADAKTIAVEAETVGSFVEISVTDDGKGIPPDQLDAIFDEFRQGYAEGEAAPKGAGLGLAITRKLVELQRGSISVESNPGRHTAFRFTLPLAPASVLAETAAAAAKLEERSKASLQDASGWKNRSETEDRPRAMEKSYRKEVRDAPRILLVEDDPVSLKVVYELLTNERYSVDAVSDGSQAMRALTGAPRWDAVILDVSLPGKTGYELCRFIRSRFSFHELPVLFLTARSQPADLMAGFDAGANDYVLKPVDSAELKARVRTLLQLKQSVREKLHMEMALIQAQIKPHFLFNALNTIASLSETDPDRMREVLTDFGLYLKNSFDLRNLNDVVPFAMEWTLVESYLSVERARFGERMRIVANVPEYAAFELPPLSIQPIVENALRHGILKRPGGGEVRIDVEPRMDRIVVAVSDNGIGFAEGTAERILSGRHEGGIGLTNIHRRLLHVYGQGLTIESSPDRGSTVRFEIPIGTKEVPTEIDEHESDHSG
ncbi:response regulator [Paenibacillus antri]|uniref:histidine kinase n=1 Tax=Paenibacillus antri TaxID=2582848 RepID=A0A5R9G3Z3_9BACL|nr:ATP-binding protein [Paenibacillus antri]TLS49739.1 response regulator [Paenibacillus antri]